MGKQLEKMGYVSDGMKTPKFFEEWARQNCMRAIDIIRDKDGDILLADSIEPVWVDPNDPHGQVSWQVCFPGAIRAYRTGYSIHRGGLELGDVCNYPADQFPLMSPDRGIRTRTEEALAFARDVQEHLINSGYYDAERKGRFSLRPN